MVGERKKDVSMANGADSKSCVSWKAELCDVVDHWLDWDSFLFRVLDLICVKLKQNPVPQFPHLPNKIHGIVCPCCAALELSS